MGFVKLAAISIAFLGGIAGTSALTYYVNSSSIKEATKRISDRLKEENFTLISLESDWQAMLTKYNDDKVKEGDRFVSGNADVSLEELKTHCNTALSEDISTSSNYFKSRRWCTVVKTLAGHLSDNGFTLLNTDNNKEDDKGSWEKLKDDYKSRGGNVMSLTLNGTDDWKTFKVKCKELSEKETVEVDFDSLFNNLKSWCTKQAADKLPR
ncbi:hypothetical protein MHC_04155 [Mycoplasma haemocanis str. Illinois]|uniref:Uncharacterized protein n=1 Tax=Mycoplasma haemocanis (strain Illinois) TaxID=1111676 RepID=H6N7R5_MYCHN|nr:hypothetical protein [Mycoplasma haemocanis]AEW45687.1 hypothetical protein MHC_04155 [Mycoplasma haemocanis str. Illinois]